MLTRRARKGTIPVIILAGFLGTGKTTILNHLLRASVGAKVAVIVNDFGAVNIDAMLITAQTNRKLELTNGCVCCSMDGGELDEAIDETLKTNPDVIIVETSGLAEPEDVARIVILSPNKQIGYGGLVYTVDTVNYHETVKRHPSIDDHIALADLVVLTKVDQAGEVPASKLMDEIKEKTTAPLVPAVRGELSPELLFDIPKRPLIQPSLLQQDEVHSHFHDNYQSVTFTSDEPIAPEKFRQYMTNLHQGIYRVKGMVYFGTAGYEQKYLLQSVGKKWDMYAEEWADHETPRTMLVLIGTDFNEKQALKGLQEAIGESDQMLDIERYIAG